MLQRVLLRGALHLDVLSSTQRLVCRPFYLNLPGTLSMCAGCFPRSSLSVAGLQPN